MAELGIFFNILLFQLSIFYFFLPEALCCCSLQTFFLLLSRACSFRAYPFNRRCAFWLKFSSPYQALHLFSTGVLSEIFLTPCSIHSIVTEAVYCDFIKYLLILSSSYSIAFLFNRSAARSCSPLFLFSNGVFSASSSPLYSFLEMT